MCGFVDTNVLVLATNNNSLHRTFNRNCTGLCINSPLDGRLSRAHMLCANDVNQLHSLKTVYA